LVGAGSMGRVWARLLDSHPEVDFVGWADVTVKHVDAACADIGIDIAHRFGSVQEGLSIRPDFVVDATVPEAHREVTLVALGAGVPVLGEKPMSDSMESAREMVQASEASGKLYMVSQSRRYNNGLAAFRSCIQELGGAGILNADFYLGPHFGGFRDGMDHPLLLDMSIHTFDAARYLTGADPVEVYAESFNPSWSWYKGDACATAIFEMTGGLRFVYRGSWCAEGLMTSWESDWRAVGPEGTAVWDGSNPPQLELVTGRGEFFSSTSASLREQHDTALEGIAGALEEFLTALDNPGRRPNGECHDNIKSLSMVFAAIESARRGQRVSFS
jgi:predicted dehydrogenase